MTKLGFIKTPSKKSSSMDCCYAKECTQGSAFVLKHQESVQDGSLSLDKVNVKDEQTQLVLLVLCLFFWFISSLWHLKECRQKIRWWYHLCACTLILIWALIVFKVSVNFPPFSVYGCLISSTETLHGFLDGSKVNACVSPEQERPCCGLRLLFSSFPTSFGFSLWFCIFCVINIIYCVLSNNYNIVIALHLQSWEDGCCYIRLPPSWGSGMCALPHLHPSEILSRKI